MYTFNGQNNAHTVKAQYYYYYHYSLRTRAIRSIRVHYTIVGGYL